MKYSTFETRAALLATTAALERMLYTPGNGISAEQHPEAVRAVVASNKILGVATPDPVEAYGFGLGDRTPTPQPEQEQQQGEPLLSGYFCGLRGLSLEMTQEQAAACSQQGSCDVAVAALTRRPEIAAQLDAIDADDIRAALEESGAWDSEELADAEQNRRRAVWLAACDIRQNPERDEETAQEEQEQQETAEDQVTIRHANAPMEILEEVRQQHAIREDYDDQTGSRYYEWTAPMSEAQRHAKQYRESVTLRTP